MSAGWPLTGFAVFILPVCTDSEEQLPDKLLPPSASNLNPPAAPLKPSAWGGAPLAPAPPPPAHSLDLSANGPQQQIQNFEAEEQHMRNNALSKKRKQTEDNKDGSNGEQQQQQQQQQLLTHVSEGAVRVALPDCIGEVVVAGAGLAAGYYRLTHPLHLR